MGDPAETLDIVPIREKAAAKAQDAMLAALARSAERMQQNGSQQGLGSYAGSGVTPNSSSLHTRSRSPRRGQLSAGKLVRRISIALAAGILIPLLVLQVSSDNKAVDGDTLQGEPGAGSVALLTTEQLKAELQAELAKAGANTGAKLEDNGAGIVTIGRLEATTELALLDQASRNSTSESTVEYISKQEVPVAPRKYLMVSGQPRTSAPKLLPAAKPEHVSQPERVNLTTLEASTENRYMAPEGSIEWQGGFRYGNPEQNLKVAKSFDQYLRSVMNDPDMESLSAVSSNSDSLLNRAVKGR